ncbi:MAG: 1-acyl-sn-glycerol-3-phosphate acyltransferase [Hyphomicrobiaceae bacterium]|nr:1-acyl-sn-glycerol-3-phosphate acyltransferase [Hyphomicrobiaceae bacterium]
MLDGLRAARVLATFLAFTLPLMPVQAVLLVVAPRQARTFPAWYHRQVLRILGLRVERRGEIVTDAPVLVVANHTSWLDIPLIGSVGPVAFIAKSEVAGWPLVGQLARLQRSVFVDRARRGTAVDSADEVATRLAASDVLVLFPEGTSSDGKRVLPFKSSLFAAVKPPARAAIGATAAAADPYLRGSAKPAVVQTLTLAYTGLHGLPLSRGERALIGWYGDMDLAPHAWELLKAGPIDAVVEISPPVPLADFADRKALAQHAEADIRERLSRILTGRAAATRHAALQQE